MGERVNGNPLKKPAEAKNPEGRKRTKRHALLTVLCYCLLALCLVCGFVGTHMQSLVGRGHLYVINTLQLALFTNLRVGAASVEALLQMQGNGLSLIGMIVFLGKHGVAMSPDNFGFSITRSRIVQPVEEVLSRGHDP